MPRVPDASSVTRLRALQSTIDPSKKSSSYVPSQPNLLSSLRASTQGQGIFPGRSLLTTSVVTPYVNSRHRGYITGSASLPSLPSLPRIEIDGAGTNFATPEGDILYAFENMGGLAPASSFEVVLINVTNPEYIGTVAISDTAGNSFNSLVTISVSPAWTGSVLDKGANYTTLDQYDTPTFPSDAVITFANLPVLINLSIHITPIVFP